MMGLAGAKRSNCPRVLSPFEIAGQRHDEDFNSNPALIAWYDFNDVSTLFSVQSGFSGQPTDGQNVGIAQNKVWQKIFDDEGAGSSNKVRAFGQYLLANTSSMAPVWHAPTDTSRGFVRFNGTTNAMFSAGTTPAGTSDGSTAASFSSSTIDMNNYTIVFVVKKDSSNTAYQNLMTLYDKTGTKLMLLSYLGMSEKLSYNSVDTTAGTPAYGQVHDDGDDGEFHYHILNAYPSYLTLNSVLWMMSDGIWNRIDTYNRYATNSTHPSTMEFDGTSHHIFLGIGCGKASSSAYPLLSSSLFKGDIYEIMIWNKDMDGGALEGADPNADKNTHRDILQYLRRKYQYTREDD